MKGRPQTAYMWNGDSALAYQVLGDGPDLVYLPPILASVDYSWLFPPYARFLRELASFSRLIFMDRRGTGCSDRLAPGQPREMATLLDDLSAILETTAAARPTLLAVNESGFVALAAAAAHPEAFNGLVLCMCSPVWTRRPDMPWEASDETAESQIRSVERSVSWDEWHRGFVRDSLPSLAGDEATIAWVSAGARSLMGPGSLVEELRWLKDLDMRDQLQAVTTRTLVINREQAAVWPVQSGRYLAEHIPNARLTTVPGEDVHPWVGDPQPILDAIQEFVTGGLDRPPPRRSVTTVLFTDVVGSTAQAVELGDARWRELLARHNEALRDRLRRHRGSEIGMTGDGFFATFDSAAEAVRCATDMTATIRQLGMEIRAGIHTGEVEHDGEDVRGIAVHIGARVMSIAGPNEVLVSSTVKDLSAGSGLEFEDAGEHELKGVPGNWHLYRVIREPA